MKVTARSVALEALLQMEQNEGYSNLVIDKALKASGLDGRDSALASAIFYGVLERRLTLDWYLRQCLRDPKKRVERTARTALRLGAYQIFYLDRVPDSAAVNETVNALKARGKSASAGFVNGVLRSLVRRKEELALPGGGDVEALSVRYSVPEELILLWQKAYGRETAEKLLGAFQEKAKTYVRLNPFCLAGNELFGTLEGGAQLESFIAPELTGILRHSGDPTELPEFQAGLFHVQDLSAQLVCEILAPKPGELVYDCCAAPGGKSFTMAQMMGGKGEVFSFDLHPSRVMLIEEGARRLGIHNLTARAADMTKPLEHAPQGDKVLCDVPCSGFGVIRRKPEIRYKSLKEVKALPELQYAILKNAANLVKPGGVLVYSTCTLNPAENGAVAERFLRENHGFSPMNIELPHVEGPASEAGASIGRLRRVVEEPPNHLTMMPFAGASDGFFAASFLRNR